ncbi:MAG: 3-hydroxybutyryl-CoA dehydratase [Bacillus thermozeamaize]|uniref:3-hydroxybutyryl-CoA dehydratase n=1 Tax=Bacillus thermozeamaize TaxID=230954 RepID=A0A1Y3PBH9_9BACI|nr:MAG: 3-hydroxybutyryl-CoA dehydratase [Bacillus thermozeamaize]
MKVHISRMSPQEKITLQETAGLAIITLHRPHLRNALTVQMWDELAGVVQRVPDNPKNRVLLIRGTGEQFTAGSDLKEFHRMSLEEAEEAFRVMDKAISAVERLPFPTVAVINGPAMGAGLQLALACDLRIGSPLTRMGMPVGRLGITLDASFTKRLVDLIGPSRTKDLVYTNRIYDAEECYQLGLLNYLVEEEQLDRFAVEKGYLIASQSPASLQAVKRNVALVKPRHEVPWGHPRHTFVDPIDFPVGVASFVEKEKPRFPRRRMKD